jgi:arylsulfatase A-like enzyme
LSEEPGSAHRILLVQVDQWAGRLLSAYDGSPVATPNLDALAAEGVLYPSAVCPSPICLPSRLSMLTGENPSTTGQLGFAGLCRAGLPWLPELLQNAGIRTAAIGKFHTRSIGASRWSFDVSLPVLEEESDLATGETYGEYCRRHGLPYPHDQTHGHTPGIGHAAAFSSSAPVEGHRMYRGAARSDVPVEHSVETWTTDRGIEALREGPGFVWLSHLRPHFPTTLPEPYFSRAVARASGLELPEALDEKLSASPRTVQQREAVASLQTIGETEFRHVIATYYTLIEWIDAEIGRLRDALRDAGVDERTSIVFTADHGDDAGFSGLYNKQRGVASWPVVNPPLIVRPAPALFPNALRGVVDTEPVSLIDVMPTVLALAGIPVEPVASEAPARPLSAVTATRDGDGGRIVFTEEGRVLGGEPCLAVSVFDGRRRFVFDSRADHRIRSVVDGIRESSAVRDDGFLRLELALVRHLARAVFGSFDDHDVADLERALSGAPGTLALHHIGAQRTVSYRAALGYRGDNHFAVIRLDGDHAPWVFRRGEPDGRDDYWTAAMAIDAPPLVVEDILMAVLDDLARRVPTVSVLRAD